MQGECKKAGTKPLYFDLAKRVSNKKGLVLKKKCRGRRMKVVVKPPAGILVASRINSLPVNYTNDPGGYEMRNVKRGLVNLIKS